MPSRKEYDARAQRLWRRRHPIKHMLRRAKIRADKANIPRCPILGIPLKMSESGYPNAGSPSLDRIVPSVGYVKGNVAVISHRANSIKRDGTAEELIQIALWVKHNTMKLRVVA